MVYKVNMYIVDRVLKGITDPITAGVVSIAILFLAIFSIYILFSSITSIYTQTIMGIKESSRFIEIKIVNATVYSNGTTYIYILNSGSIPIVDITKMEISVTINNSNTYLLKYSPSLAIGSWTPLYISIGNTIYPANRFSLKPGETLAVKALIQSYINPGSYIEIVAFLPNGKAHIVRIAGG